MENSTRNLLEIEHENHEEIYNFKGKWNKDCKCLKRPPKVSFLCLTSGVGTRTSESYED